MKSLAGRKKKRKCDKTFDFLQSDTCYLVKSSQHPAERCMKQKRTKLNKYSKVHTPNLSIHVTGHLKQSCDQHLQRNFRRNEVDQSLELSTHGSVSNDIRKRNHNVTHKFNNRQITCSSFLSTGLDTQTLGKNVSPKDNRCIVESEMHTNNFISNNICILEVESFDNHKDLQAFTRSHATKSFSVTRQDGENQTSKKSNSVEQETKTNYNSMEKQKGLYTHSCKSLYSSTVSTHNSSVCTVWKQQGNCDETLSCNKQNSPALEEVQAISGDQPLHNDTLTDSIKHKPCDSFINETVTLEQYQDKCKAEEVQKTNCCTSSKQDNNVIDRSALKTATIMKETVKNGSSLVYGNKSDFILELRDTKRTRSCHFESTVHSKEAPLGKKNEKCLKRKSVKYFHAGNRFICKVCRKEYRKEKSMLCHVIVHTAANPFFCRICHRRFFSKKDLNSHSKVHAKDKCFHCDVCGKGFNKTSNIVKHKKIHEHDNLFICDFCEKQFLSNTELIKHLVLHGETAQPHACSECGKVYGRRLHLQNHHQSIHLSTSPHECPICSQKFSSSDKLKSHMDSHGRKSHTCDTCGETFNHKSSLVYHCRVHQGIKPYKCEFCSEEFRTSSAKSNHIKRHLGIKPHKCDICGKCFVDLKGLRAHYQSHSKTKPYSCKLCSKSYRDPRSLKKHSLTHSTSMETSCDKADNQQYLQ